MSLPASAPPGSSPVVEASLLERLGGEDALAACIKIFYEKNLSDERILRFFEGVDMARLARHQTSFMRSVFTNSLSKYTGQNMEAAHARLIRDKGLNRMHFDCVAENLVASLTDLHVAQPLIDEVMALVLPLRPLFPEEEALPAEQESTSAAEPSVVSEPAPSAGPSPAVMEASLLERLGGEAALAACIKIFYEKNLSDERIARFFEGMDMQRLERHQTDFMRNVFTGQLSKYTATMVQAAHARLIADKGLNASHFDCVAENLVASLCDLNVPEPLIVEVADLVLPLRTLFPEAVALPKDPTPGDSPSLLERLGGDAALEACVAVFYTKNLADQRIARFFEGVDVKRLERHQAVFLRHVFTDALGKYTGATMQAAHARLIADQGLNASHFDCVAENLVASLQDQHVPQGLVNEVVGLVGPLRHLFPEANSNGV